MPDALSVSIELQTVTCHSQADSLIETATTIPDDDAEPYLLTVFFKVDGERAFLTDEFALAGAATVVGTPGTHGNLGDISVEAGDVIPIPSAIGQFQTLLRPIALPEPCDALLPEGVPGVVGVLCILLEHDNVTDAGAQAGHDALDAAVKSALDEVVNSLSIDNPGADEDQIAALAEQIRQAVEDAIVGEQNLAENVLTLINADDALGFTLFLFEGAELATAPSTPINARYTVQIPIEGLNDWEINGRITSGPTSFAGVIGSLVPKLGARVNLDALRALRRGLLRHPRAGAWLTLLSANGGPVAAALAADKGLREAGVDLLAAVADAARAPDEPLRPELLASAAAVIEGVLARAPRQTQRDLRLLRGLLPLLKGTTLDEAVMKMDELRPLRPPQRGGK